MKTIEGMSILVTGGGSGIGTDCARRFCAQGARVTISGRRLEKLQAVQTELGANCHIVQGDVTVQADREAMLSEAVKHGNDRLDALVNNAANMYRQPVDGYTETFLKEAFDTNVVSAMMLSSMAIPHLEKTQGSIVFIGRRKLVAGTYGGLVHFYDVCEEAEEAQVKVNEGQQIECMACARGGTRLAVGGKFADVIVYAVQYPTPTRRASRTSPRSSASSRPAPRWPWPSTRTAASSRRAATPRSCSFGM